MSTDTTERPGGGPEKLHPGAGDTFWEGVIFTLAATAILAWFAGMALNRSFGVHAPFMGTWLLMVAGLVLVRLTALTVAGAWFGVKTKATPNIAAAEYVGQVAAEDALAAQRAGGFDKLLAEIRATAKEGS